MGGAEGRSLCGCGGRAGASPGEGRPYPRCRRGEDGGQGAAERDEPGGGDGARTHGPDVGLPQIGRAHAGDGAGARVERARKVRAEEVDGGHQDQPGEGSAGEQDGGDADADDVADAKVLRRDVGADGCALQQMLRAEIRLVVRCGREEAEEVFVLQQGVQATEAEAEEAAGGKGAATLASQPPKSAKAKILVDSRSKPRKIRAGRVKMTPDAID